MKHFISKLLVVALLTLSLGGIVSTQSGCSLATQQSAVMVEYQSLSGVIHVVDVARGVYDDLYKAGKVSQDLDNKVAVVYAEYQRVGNLAITVAKGQAAVVNAGGTLTDATNVFIPQLQTLINQLLALFNSAPGAPQTAPVVIAPNAGV